MIQGPFWKPRSQCVLVLSCRVRTRWVPVALKSLGDHVPCDMCEKHSHGMTWVRRWSRVGLVGTWCEREVRMGR